LKALPDSFSSLCSLQLLTLAECENLECLPESFISLSSLQKLDLRLCTALARLPSDSDSLRSLLQLGNESDTIISTDAETWDEAPFKRT
jgi:Leucine-rich repeat (LRR) protein